MTTVVDIPVPSDDAFFVELERRQREVWDAEERAVEELAALSSHLTAATARFVELVWQQRELFGEDVARFIAYRCGITGREANEYLRVAEALRELPVIRGAFGRGEVTYAKVRALTRVATVSSEEGLLELAAVLTAAQLQRALRVYERATVEDARDTHELEYVSYWFADDGSLMLRARLAAEDGTLVVKALDAARERVIERRRAERRAARVTRAEPADTGLPEPRAAGVEAFVDLVQSSLDATCEPQAPRARVVVHIDAAALSRDGDGRSELEDGPVISPETARRLGCDADVVAQIEQDGLPLTVGRTRRTVPPALRRLLEARDDTRCCFPGCERRRHLQAHHRQHWAHGGETGLDNLVLLCFHHHRLVHEGGYSIEGDAAEGLRFRNHRGVVCSTLPPKPPPGSLEALLAEHRRLELDIGPQTNRHGGGDGIDRFDLVCAVDAVGTIIDRSARDWAAPPTPLAPDAIPARLHTAEAPSAR